MTYFPFEKGQTAMAGSAPVVIADDQSPIPVSGAIGVTGIVSIDGTVPVSGTFWQDVQDVAAGQSGEWFVGVTGGLPLPSGAATADLQSDILAGITAIQSSVSTEATQELVLAGVTGIESIVATELTQQAVLAGVTGIQSVVATEATLAELTVPQGALTDNHTITIMGGAVSTTPPGYTSGQLYPVSMDTAGNVRVYATIGDRVRPATYSAAHTFTAGATPTDIFTIYGSSTKTVKVTKLSIGGTRQQSGTENIYLKRRSTANTGGTSVSPARVPHDSANSAATATVAAYTVNPTVGTEVGDVAIRRAFIPSANTSPGGGEVLLVDSSDRTQAVVLRGAGQGLAVNLGGVTITGNVFALYVTWTEE